MMDNHLKSIGLQTNGNICVLEFFAVKKKMKFEGMLTFLKYDAIVDVKTLIIH
jgi:hypothetical protein